MLISAKHEVALRLTGVLCVLLVFGRKHDNANRDVQQVFVTYPFSSKNSRLFCLQCRLALMGIAAEADGNVCLVNMYAAFHGSASKGRVMKTFLA